MQISLRSHLIAGTAAVVGASAIAMTPVMGAQLSLPAINVPTVAKVTLAGLDSPISELLGSVILGGQLLFNVSKQALNPGPNFGAYGIAKAALLALMRQYALEGGPEGIRSNAINADRIRSGLLDDAMIRTRSAARGLSEADYMAGNLLSREVRASDVADAFVSLAQLERSTGVVLTVDGGNVAAMVR